MDKQKICYDLALIYARRMLGFYLQHQSRHMINQTESLAKKLFCFFEEAYNLYLNMDEHEFAFVLEQFQNTDEKTDASFECIERVEEIL